MWFIGCCFLRIETCKIVFVELAIFHSHTYVNFQIIIGNDYKTALRKFHDKKFKFLSGAPKRLQVYIRLPLREMMKAYTLNFRPSVQDVTAKTDHDEKEENC